MTTTLYTPAIAAISYLTVPYHTLTPPTLSQPYFTTSIPLCHNFSSPLSH